MTATDDEHIRAIHPSLSGMRTGNVR
jgi:hypothetical protein